MRADYATKQVWGLHVGNIREIEHGFSDPPASTGKKDYIFVIYFSSFKGLGGLHIASLI